MKTGYRIKNITTGKYYQQGLRGDRSIVRWVDSKQEATRENEFDAYEVMYTLQQRDPDLRLKLK
jgi:hypothetical protein